MTITAADTPSVLVCLTSFFVSCGELHAHKQKPTQQYSACCAHAFKPRGLGVHIKLIKSVVEIMVCCRPGTSVQWLGRLLIFRWQGGSGWMRVGELFLVTIKSTFPMHTSG